MHNNVIHGREAREALLKGVDKVYNAVACTLGPYGKIVILQKSYDASEIHLTKDGVTVAKGIELKNQLEMLGAKMIQEAAVTTDNVIGDGTTTATILAGRLILSLSVYMDSGINRVHIAELLNRYKDIVLAQLETYITRISDKKTTRNIALISSNNSSEIADIVVESFDRVGIDGVIRVESSSTDESYVEHMLGLSFDRGWLNPYMATRKDVLITEYTDAFVCIMQSRIQSIDQILPIIDFVRESNRALLLIADDYTDESMAALTTLKSQQGVKVVAVKTPGTGRRKTFLSQDIAVVTGAKIIEDLSNYSPAKILGAANSIVVSKDRTIIIGGQGKKENVDAVVQNLKELRDTQVSKTDKEVFTDRINNLTGGVAIVCVAGETDLVIKEKKDRVVDAIHATRAALKGGIVPGGGLALYRAVDILDSWIYDENKSSISEEEIVKGLSPEARSLHHSALKRVFVNAIKEPFIRIVQSSGADEHKIINALMHVKKKDKRMGFDARTPNTLVDMYVNGVVDPADVVKTAFSKGLSVALSFLMTEAAIYEDLEDTPPSSSNSLFTRKPTLVRA